MEYFIGMNSGTSMDAIDVAIVEFDEHQHKLKLLNTYNHAIPPEIQKQTMDISQEGNITLQTFGELDHQWGLLFAEAITETLSQAELTAKDITAIGSHGQAIWHAPNATHASTIQIGDPNIIAKRTNITTIADFRRGDLALGGQGAPLAPIFHHWLFASEVPRAVVNIGGIANISLLKDKQLENVIGFDTGPGNGLIDSWMQYALKQPFDQKGQMAQNGHLQNTLLNKFLNDDYFRVSHPKSTGKDYFNLQWIRQKIGKDTYSNEDMICTLAHLTCQTIATDIQKHFTTAEVIVCGGGTKNPFIMAGLKQSLGTNFSLTTTQKFGLAPDWIEACMFAWLAQRRLMDQPLNLSSVTGVAKACTLGGIYSAK